MRSGGVIVMLHDDEQVRRPASCHRVLNDGHQRGEFLQDVALPPPSGLGDHVVVTLQMLAQRLDGPQDALRVVPRGSTRRPAVLGLSNSPSSSML